MYEARSWHTEKMVQATVENLRKNGFNALYIPRRKRPSEQFWT